VDVAVVDDTNFLLHAARTEVRPGGPEVDGFLGAAALAQARVELDYVTSQPRGIFSCEPGSPPERCRAVARCPRLPGPGQRRACFGLPAHGLPNLCDDAMACAD
jgi:hypothetical protein